MLQNSGTINRGSAAVDDRRGAGLGTGDIIGLEGTIRIRWPEGAATPSTTGLRGTSPVETYWQFDPVVTPRTDLRSRPA